MKPIRQIFSKFIHYPTLEECESMGDCSVSKEPEWSNSSESEMNSPSHVRSEAMRLAKLISGQ